MKRITITLAFLMTLSSAGWSETMDDLVLRNDLWYQKFTDIPFTGEVSGLVNGTIKTGSLKRGCVKT